MTRTAGALSRIGSRAAAAGLLLALAAALGPAAHPVHAQSLYWLDTNHPLPTLNRSDLNGLGVTSLALAPGSLPEGLAAAANGRVFWTEAVWSNAKLHRVVHDLTGDVALVSGGSVLRGIAVDEAAQMLYWTTSNLATGSKVMRSNINGGGVTTLITLPAAANPRGIAVGLAAGRIYWTDLGQNAIYSANLDGTNQALWLASGAGGGPYGVAVDPVSQRVYWTDYIGGKVRRAEADGSGIATVAGGLVNPTYLAFDAPSSRIYLTQGGAGAQSIVRMNSDGSGQVALPPPLTTYGGIAIGPGTSVAVEAELLPTEFAIERVWPTPASGPLHLKFALPRDADVRLTIMDIQGREVAVLADGLVPAGRHERTWAGRTGRGPAAAGVYFARLTADGRAWVKRVVLTR